MKKNHLGAERCWYFPHQDILPRGCTGIKVRKSLVPILSFPKLGDQRKGKQLTISLLIINKCVIKGVGVCACVCVCVCVCAHTHTHQLTDQKSNPRSCFLTQNGNFYSLIISPWLLHWPASVWDSRQAHYLQELKSLGSWMAEGGHFFSQQQSQASIQLKVSLHFHQNLLICSHL